MLRKDTVAVECLGKLIKGTDSANIIIDFQQLVNKTDA